MYEDGEGIEVVLCTKLLRLMMSLSQPSGAGGEGREDQLPDRITINLTKSEERQDKRSE